MEPKKSITLHGRRFSLYIREADIHEAIGQVAEQINEDYRQGEFERPILLITLNGAVVFGGELFRQLEGDFEVAFVKIASYGSGTESSGNVQVEVPITADLNGRDVIVAEDVVDSGKTIKMLSTLLGKANAKSMRVATLVLKPEAYAEDVPVDYVALDSEDQFIVGYGMDYDQQGRNLNAIYALDE